LVPPEHALDQNEYRTMVITCPNCGAKNRVDETRARTMDPVCGRCKTKLPVPQADSSHPTELTDANFDAFLQSAGSNPVLVDCWAPWCGPCRMLTPIIDQLAAESNGRFIVAKLNTDQNPRIAGLFRIDAIPAMLIFKNAQLVDKLVGLQPKESIARRLEAAERA
jgi:thioredoxin